jgi:RNA polymerase sigma-70 factor (ECF subfamily)
MGHCEVRRDRYNPGDEELVAEFREGRGPASERELFDEIFDRYHLRIAAWCYRFTSDRELALDLAQEIFMKAFRRFHTFRSDSKLSTWLYSITRNHCIDAVNRRAAELIDSVDLNAIRVPDRRAVNAEAALGKRQEQQRLLGLVAERLNGLETKVMVLHYGHDVPINAVTSMLSLKNPSGAKAYIVSARRKLAKLSR